MGFKADKAASVLFPKKTDVLPRQWDRLAGTTGEDSTTVAIPAGAMCTILVGAAPIRFTLAATAGLADQVAATDPPIGAYGRADFTAEPGGQFVYVQSADGSTAYECFVCQSSPVG